MWWSGIPGMPLHTMVPAGGGYGGFDLLVDGGDLVKTDR